MLLQIQRGMSGCSPAPNPASGITAWNSPVGFAEDWFYNPSATPVTIESLSLLDPHNLVLHGGVVYEMPHSQHPLLLQTAWAKEGQGADPVTWAHRQPVRGAVILAEHVRRTLRSTVYVIVADISDATRGGGRALGEVVRYRAAGRTYTLKAEEGMAIGSALVPIDGSCDAQFKDLSAALVGKS